MFDASEDFDTGGFTVRGGLEFFLSISEHHRENHVDPVETNPIHTGDHELEQPG